MAARRSGWRVGEVGEVAAEWGVAERLARAAPLGVAYHECLASMVEADGRASVQAGKAWPSEQRIILHQELLKPGREEDRNATFLHECAHVLADLFHERPCRHGDPWREMMRLLGEVPNVRHRIPYLSREANAKIVWRCTGCDQAYHYVRRPRRRLKDCYCADCGPVQGRLREETPS